MKNSRSVLYNVPPVNKENEYIESLSSFIERIASLHCITVGDLMSVLLTPNMNKLYLNNISIKGGDGFYKTSNAVNGKGVIANDFISVMQSLTGRDDLLNTTLVNINNILADRGLLRSKKAWCPICLQKMKDGDQKEVYYPLLWSLKSYKICTKHLIKLIITCPNCFSSLSVLSRKSVPGYCSKCLNWLGKAQVEQKELCFNDQLRESEFVKQFIKLCIEKNSLQYKNNDITESIRYITNICFENNIKKASAGLGFPYTTFVYWYKGYSIPPIHSVISLCTRLNIELIDFLNCKIESKNIQFTPSTIKFLTPKNRYDDNYIYSLLREVIRKEVVISLTQLANIIGCHRTLIAQKFPEESKKIIENNRVFMSSEKDARIKQKIREVDNAFYLIIKNGLNPSFSQMEKLIGANTLREKFLREHFDKLRNVIQMF